METLISPISLDYFSERTLTAKAGISRPWWPEMVAKELVDNALAAAGGADPLRLRAGTDTKVERATNRVGGDTAAVVRHLDVVGTNC